MNRIQNCYLTVLLRVTFQLCYSTWFISYFEWHIAQHSLKCRTKLPQSKSYRGRKMLGNSSLLSLFFNFDFEQEVDTVQKCYKYILLISSLNSPSNTPPMALSQVIITISVTYIYIFMMHWTHTNSIVNYQYQGVIQNKILVWAKCVRCLPLGVAAGT